MSEVIKEGFKIVSMDILGRFWSYMVSYPVYHTTDDQVIQYNIDSWSKPHPKCGPLVLFEKETDAKIYLNNQKSNIDKMDLRFKNILFRCKFIPTIKKSIYYCKNSEIIEIYELSILPEGTVLASKVMLTERI